MIVNFPILKLFYKAMLTGMPIAIFNPYTNNRLLAPCTIKSGSTYINYKLNEQQKNTMQDYIGNNLKLIPTTLSLNEPYFKDNESEPYYLSINIYNCTSPLFKFVSNKEITRCEINTYVKDITTNEYGTLIMDYTSNKGSIDPVTIYQSPNEINLQQHINEEYNTVITYGSTFGNNINLSFSYVKTFFDKLFNMNSNLIKFTDNIFYRNGVIDKLYYDRSLVYSKQKIPKLLFINFTFLNMTFDKPDSIFYFPKDIEFVGSIWHNLENL
jgi:hypothetical protein